MPSTPGVAPALVDADQGDLRRLPDGGLTPEALFDFHVRAANVFLDAGMARRAAEALVEADEAAPRHPPAREALSRAAFAWEQAGESARARQAHEFVLRAYPEWEHLDLHWFRVGILAEDEGDLEGAEVAYEEMLGRYFDAGERWDALFNLARLYEQNGRWQQASLLYGRWAREQPLGAARFDAELRAASLLLRTANGEAGAWALLKFLDQYPPGSVEPQLRARAYQLLQHAADGGPRWMTDGGDVPARR